jgi:hypothetical protein
MTDITLAGTITRTTLALADLDINDHLNFILGVPLLGGQGKYDRNKTGGSYMEGEVTVNRKMPNITEIVTVEVRGAAWSDVMANALLVRQAFTQDNFVLNITINGNAHSWQCEAADWSYDLSQGRIASGMPKFTFEVPRRPIALAGQF